MNTLSRFLVVAIAISSFLVAFNQRGIERLVSGKSLTNPMLEPGENLDAMVITTGVEDAIPLWDFCPSTNANDHSIRVDCGKVPDTKLAIGHTFGVMDLIRQCIDWEEYSWELSVDGHPIDLEAFGVYDIRYPDLAPHPAPVREVFKRVRLWNVVLVNPTPGMHRLQGQVQSRDGAATYAWDVKFTVATYDSLPLAKSSPPFYISFQQGGGGYPRQHASLL